MASKKMIAAFLILGLVAVATGCSDSDTNSPVAATPDTAPPALPSNLAVEFTDGAAVVSWDISIWDADLAGYIVTREQSGATDLLIETPTIMTTFEDSAPLTGSSLYHVYAVDTSGNESAVVTTNLLVKLSREPGIDPAMAE
jgi:hypothetical protein